MNLKRPVTAVMSLTAMVCAVMPAMAYDLTFNAPSTVEGAVKGASLLAQSGDSAKKDGQDILAEARADYGRIVSALFAQGYYSGVVSIKLDGREAATIPPLDAPPSISKVDVTVTPGRPFHFSRAQIGPLASRTQLPPDFAKGQVAKSGAIISAASAAQTAWRDAGHAKVRVASQSVVADHRNDTVAADIGIAPGPRVSFGPLTVTGNKRLRTKRLREMAGYPLGEVYDPAKVEQMQARLQRTGIFSSVTVTEADKVGPNDTLPMTLAVVEQKKRKISFGAELNSNDGVGLSAAWLHRNLLGGGERFSLDGEIKGIGGNTGGIDYALGSRLERPATFNPDTSAYLETNLSRQNQSDYDQSAFDIGFGVTRIFNDKLTGDAAIKYGWSKVSDSSGTTYFRQVYFPTSLTWDRRNDKLDPTGGFYAKAGFTPFFGIGPETGTGAQVTADLRGYKGFGADNRFVLAARLQYGRVFGASLGKTPRDYLFYSGGGGTVRGQPYQSLGVSVLDGGTLHTGGSEFLGASGELRMGITKTIGVVAFYDWGHIAGGGQSGSQAGAGLGLRYKTGIGPIRLDVGLPVSGGTGSGAQLYIGIGQAF